MEKKFIDYAEKILGVRKKLGQLVSEAEVGMWEHRSPAKMEREVVALLTNTAKELDEIIAKYL